MPSKSWRKSASVIENLLANPRRFSFIQIARLLELSFARYNEQATSDDEKTYAANAVARFSPPQRESIRFINSHSLAFPESEITNIVEADNTHDLKQWRVFTSFFGLSGSPGVLPFHYSELLLFRLKQKDRSIEEFFNLFNHRSVSLFFQAAVKYRLPIEYERKRQTSKLTNDKDAISTILQSLVGFGTQGLQGRLPIHDDAFIFYGGLFSQQVRSSSGLSRMLSAYYRVPIHIEEFLGRWQELIDDIRSRLPDKENPRGQNICLGRNTMLGKRGWFAQGKIRIVLGPVSRDEFQRFAPGSAALKSLNELVRLYVGVENDYEFKLLVDRAAIPNRVALRQTKPPILGWNGWLAKRASELNDSRQKLMTVSISPTSINSR